MNENAKKAGLIALIVVAVGAAVFGGSQFFKGEQPEITKTVQMPKGGGEKSQALKNAAQSQSGTPTQGGERDLSGGL